MAAAFPEVMLRSREVDLDGVINHQIDRNKRLDDLRALAHSSRSRAHRREVHKKRHAGEVLEQYARNHERDLFGAQMVRFPVREPSHVVLGDALAVIVAQH